LNAIKLIRPSKEDMERHYEHLNTESFFQEYIDHMTSGDIVCMIWEGNDCILSCKNLIGATNPVHAMPGTIRGDMASKMKRNLCHGSDSIESARKEISIWFPELNYD
jgi:nucleoside-diphosphate kinase